MVFIIFICCKKFDSNNYFTAHTVNFLFTLIETCGIINRIEDVRGHTGLGGSTRRLHHKDTDMWIYKCDAGTYTEDSLTKLLYVIFAHRFSHLLKGEGFRD